MLTHEHVWNQRYSAWMLDLTTVTCWSCDGSPVKQLVVVVSQVNSVGGSWNERRCAFLMILLNLTKYTQTCAQCTYYNGSTLTLHIRFQKLNFYCPRRSEMQVTECLQDNSKSAELRDVMTWTWTELLDWRDSFSLL